MPVFEFQLTCLDDKACREIQNDMSSFRNKMAKGNKDHDHTATKTFDSWEKAIEESKVIKSRFPKKIIDLTITEK